MSERIKTGGPAFPQPNHLIETDRGREQARGWMEDSGMSIRTYIATAALTGWAAGRNLRTTDDFTGPDHHQKVATACVRYADALIAELEKGTL